MPEKKVRFACGSPEKPYSAVWRLVVNKDDVYLGASAGSMGIFKLSLHKSGIWTLAGTRQSGAAFDAAGNRRAKRWVRPAEHVTGITRGPSIFVPCTSLGSRTLSELEVARKIIWHPAPAPGTLVEFSLYLLAQGAPEEWPSHQKVLAELALASGGKVTLLGESRSTEDGFQATCEQMIRESVFTMHKESDYDSAFLLWVSDSSAPCVVPILTDLPVLMEFKEK